MHARLCSKVGCNREAFATLTYDYHDKMAALGPLGAAGYPHAHDLCFWHCHRMTVPAGWVIERHESVRQALDATVAETDPPALEE
ncbi:DUF3499 family protein [Microbacterium sp. YY-01]|uniref:DUF3499 family protein n=1 Tax=Microbacterium sp. YY-01 TaxID=3421634 RepID=UPI003D17C014